jgi:hypothetical protein
MKALLIVSPALLWPLAFQVHRQNLVSEHVLGALQRADNRFLKDLRAFDKAFHARAVEPGQISMKPMLATRTPSAGTIGSSMEGVLHICSGDWIADVALWCRWHTQGTLLLVRGPQEYREHRGAEEEDLWPQRQCGSESQVLHQVGGLVAEDLRCNLFGPLGTVPHS